MSFDEETLELRQPLSNIFKRLCHAAPEPHDNGQANTATNKAVNEFIAENYTDLMFLRLPRPCDVPAKTYLGRAAWQEEWIRGTDAFWEQFGASVTGSLGSHVSSRGQYLELLEEVLKTASHIPAWAIAHSDNNLVSTDDIVQVISSIRRVDTIYTKDFSELTGVKATIITA
jgi:hypothetical protein